MKRIAAAFPLLVLAACGTNTTPQTESKQLPAAAVDPATAGTITGSVFFTGTAPDMPTIDMSSNPQCERQHRTPKKAEIVVVNSNGTLRNVFVYISGGLPRVQWPEPKISARLDQSGCVYSPHVLGIMEGQQLEISNNDPVNHNVHAEAKVNEGWNESQPPRAEHKFKHFNAEEILFPVTCSVHPWMRAWIGVSPHPYFAVTGKDGSFALPNVPPGTYTIEAVHEKYGKKQGRVSVSPHAIATLDLSYGN